MKKTTTSALDLNLLAIAAALLNAGSVSKAAILLDASQPAVSAALAKLRLHFGDPLFVRCTGGMAPTPKGAEVAHAACEILQEVERRLPRDQTFDPGRPQRPFTFALSDVGEIVFLPPLVSALARLAPKITVRSISLRPELLAQSLADGDTDLAIGYFPDLRSGEFFQQRLLMHHFACLLRAGHPVQSERLSMEQFLGLEHAVVRSEGRSQELLEAYLEQRGLTRRVSVYTPHFLSIPQLISRSDMLVTVPHAVAMQYGNAMHGLRTAQLPFESPRIELKQHWHRKFHKDTRNTWLRQVVAELFHEGRDEWVVTPSATRPVRGLRAPAAR